MKILLGTVVTLLIEEFPGAEISVHRDRNGDTHVRFVYHEVVSHIIPKYSTMKPSTEEMMGKRLAEHLITQMRARSATDDETEDPRSWDL